MDFTKDKNKLFWILNTAGWIILLVLTLILFYSEKLNDYMSVIGVSITYAVGFVVTVGLRYLYRRVDYKKHSIAFTAVLIFIISVLVTHFWYWLDIFVSIYCLYGYDKRMWLLPPSFQKAESTVLSFFPIIVAWSLFYFSYKLWLDWMQQKERAEKAVLLAHKAQLQMLRYQLNPHFLFNALNSVRALIESNKNAAKDVITELSEFLRYSLVSRNLNKVPLKDEIEAIKHYFTIQKIRYEERLEVSFDIKPDADEFPVLSFLVHPIIENAVKYGMETSPMPLKIGVSARVEGSKLILDVSNTGRWVEKAGVNSGTGTGLENVKQRLENAFPGNYSFEVIKDADAVHVKIEITQNKD